MEVHLELFDGMQRIGILDMLYLEINPSKSCNRS